MVKQTGDTIREEIRQSAKEQPPETKGSGKK
jgi:hypothetical protein